MLARVSPEAILWRVSRDRAAAGQVEALGETEVLLVGRAIAPNGDVTTQPIIKASETEEKERREGIIAIFVQTFDKFYPRWSFVKYDPEQDLVTVEAESFLPNLFSLADALPPNRSSILIKNISVRFSEISS